MVGERLPMVMDPAVCATVTGQPGRLASPRAGAAPVDRATAPRSPAGRSPISSTARPEAAEAGVHRAVPGHHRHRRRPVRQPAASRTPPTGARRWWDIVTTADGEPAVTYQRAPLLPQATDAQPGHDDDLGTVPPPGHRLLCRAGPGALGLRPAGPGNRLAARHHGRRPRPATWSTTP